MATAGPFGFRGPAVLERQEVGSFRVPPSSSHQGFSTTGCGKRDSVGFLFGLRRDCSGRVLTRSQHFQGHVTRWEAAVVTEKMAGESAPATSRKRVLGKGVRLIGSGSAVPAREISNELLSTLVDTNDEWISSRTGIRKRRVLSGSETLTSLATEAARKALEMAELDAADLDLVILCTSTPDDIFGGACQIQAALGCKKAVAFDLTAACSGFIMGLVTASRFVKGGGYENVLIIGADALSRYVDWTDRGTCILFGDASGALVLRATKDGEEDGLLGFDMRSDGNGFRHLNAVVGVGGGAGAAHALAPEPQNGAAVMAVPPRACPSFIYMNGKEVFRFAVKAVPQVIEGAMAEAGVTSADVDWLLLHQANQRILDAAAEKMSVPSDRVLSNLSNYGNTSAASIPLALDEAVRGGKIRPGHLVATAGFGAGLSWAGAIVRWG